MELNGNISVTCGILTNISCWRSTVNYFNDRWIQLMIPVEIMLCVFMIVGVIGNTLVLVIYSHRRQKTSANIFIMFLAGIDLFACVVLHPYVIYKEFHNYDQNWEALCKLFEYLNHSILALSSLTLVLVAIDRYLAICRPVKFLAFDKHIVKGITTISLLSFVVSLPILEFYGTTESIVLEFDSTFTGYKCHIKDQYINSIALTSFGAFVMCGFILELIVMAVLYKHVAVTAYWSNRRVSPLSNAHILAGIQPALSNSQTKQPSSTTKITTTNVQVMAANFQVPNDPTVIVKPDREKLKSFVGTTDSVETNVASNRNIILNSKDSQTNGKSLENRTLSSRLKAVKILFSVTMVFLVSWMPFLAMRLRYTVDPGYWNDLSESSYVIENLLNRFFYLNNAANPILYTLINKNFRRDCKAVFAKYFHARN